MAKNLKSTTPGDVAAAHADLEQIAQRVGRHKDTLKAHSDELERELDEAKTALAQEKSAHEKESADLRLKLERLTVKAEAAVKERDEKLKRAFNVLNAPGSTGDSILG